MQIATSIRKMPLSHDRLGWHEFYVRRFEACVRQNQNYRPAEHLALWYLFLHLSDGETDEQ